MKKFWALFLGVALLLTACGGGEKVAKSPDADDLFVATYPTDILVKSPQGTVEASTKRVLRNMNEGIYRYDENGELEFGIAKNVAAKKEGDYIVFDIELRDDVKFHNGRDLTSEDVKYSYERLAGLVDGIGLDMVQGGGNFKNLLNGDEEEGYIKGKIEIIDDYKLRLYVDSGYGILTSKHSLADGFLVPANYSEDDQLEHPIGVGPYKFVEHKAGNYIRFERFEDYYGEKPDLKNVEFRKYSDQSTIPLAFYSGEVNILNLNNENYEKVKDDDYPILDGLSNDVRVLYMNQREGKLFSNKDLRIAFNHAIDKEKMLESISSGRGAILDSHFTPFLKNYYNSDLKNFYKYDKKKAEKYLEKAGFNKEEVLVMKTVVENEIEQDIAALIIEDLAQIGVKVKNDPIPWNVYYEEVYKKHNFDLTILNVVGYPDPFRMLSRYETTGSSNVPGFSNERYDQILKEIQALDNRDKEIEYYKELQRILTEDAVGVFTIDPGMSVALSKGYDKYVISPFAYVNISSIKRR